MRELRDSVMTSVHTVVNTRSMFCRLLRILAIKSVCDVGSMDGADALRFRKALPRATIIAFEANPNNYALMADDETLRRRSIKIFPYAVSDSEGVRPFYVVDADYSPRRDRFRRGIGSLYPRLKNCQLAQVAQVRTVRLDDFLKESVRFDRPLALWIDVEGKAFEVIKGAEKMLPAVAMLHVEVEAEPLLAPEQKLFEDVDGLLVSAGFVLVATDERRDFAQIDALYVRAQMLSEFNSSIRFWRFILRLRWIVAQRLWRLFPLRLRRFLIRVAYRP